MPLSGTAKNRSDRQREGEGGPFARRGLGADRAAMAAHDALHDGEADAVALEAGRRGQALEGAEQARRVAHVEADAVVAHRVLDLAVAPHAGDLDARRGAGARVL